jgi:tetratricopeptide (TPR) repeat protein
MPDHTPHFNPDPSPAEDPAAAVTRPQGEAAGEPTVESSVVPVEPAARTSPPGYRLLEPVGRGGMGVVFRARDLSLNRDVAVKMLREDIPASPAAVRRFLVEARVTGRLQHPGIPPVHQVGELPGGRPFLAMKLIKGRTLAELLAGGATARGELLAAFEHVCQAMAYAHSRGVIHRDLKPHNIMVGRFGEIQVMDWGVAKQRVDTAGETTAPGGDDVPDPCDVTEGSKTAAGVVLGTPAYMPPEQAAGLIDEVDERADVFGLGGVLCAILTGKPPFVAATGESTRQLAAAGNVSDAFARLDRCGAEPQIVALCKRCLSPERDGRPRDAGEVARVVAELRAAAEERARRAELDRVRATEQRKRARVQLALTGSLLLLAVGGGAAAWWLDRQAAEREVDARRAEADRKASEARLAGERDAESRLKAEQARHGVATNLNLAAALRDQYKFTAAEAALAQAEELAAGGAPELLPPVRQAQLDLAFVVQLDDIRFRKWVWVVGPGGAGEFDTRIAPPEYRAAFARHGLDVTALDPAEAARRIGASVVKAALVAALDDWALYEPEPRLRARLLEVARSADPGEWTDRLRDPANWASRAAVVKLAAEAAADPAAFPPAALGVLAELMQRNGLSPAPLLSAARAAHPANFELAFALGQWHTVNGKRGEQIGPYEAARALRPDNVTVWNNLGAALDSAGDTDGAAAAFRAIIRLAPGNAQAHNNLGICLGRRGKADAAIAAYREAIRCDPNYTLAHYNLGVALRAKGDLPGAVEAYRNAVRCNPELAPAHYNLGNALYARADMPGAITAYKAAIKFGWDNALAHYNLANALYLHGEPDDAVAEYREALARDPKLVFAHTSLGVALMAKGDVKGAVAAHKEAVRLDRKNALAHANLGVALDAAGDAAAAAAEYREALAIDPRHAVAHAALGRHFLRERRHAEAVASALRAIGADSRRVDAYVLLASALRDLAIAAK